MMRSTCIELGLSTSAVAAPLKGSAIKNFAIPNTISQGWYLGRAVHIANLTKTSFTDAIVCLYIKSLFLSDCEQFQVLPGKLLFVGKIVDVSRDVSKGYTVGKCLIAPLSDVEIKPGDRFSNDYLAIPFQNEYLSASLTDATGRAKMEAICTVPDLISVLGEDGEGIGSQDLRYGLRVKVIGMPAHPLWTQSEKAMKIGGPEYFGLGTEWKSIGDYSAPKSVIQEFR